MKKIFFILLIGLTFMAGCTGIKSTTQGLENESFLELVGDTHTYKDGVEVNIDGNTSFKAFVNKANSNRPKGQVYAISTGKHVISINHNNKIIYKKQIFVSAQETKRIVLP
ncbi:hypothetical protein [Saccharicrinis fermentans]|uniref:Lipoprotein n=1 Tax=Saccharicrinis fermentans DSM 9555 = JCM 21142 TaxID=869213 RepID=W7YN79_9BACT|nr:hypothetical protein [Saccharicrinis fermentans]GAF03879.1 hypothetical protein JCM21142_72567 [Saccharicrinis fermentans DSM 9555 = JCM 21142]